jgi:hypothetical protein
VKYTHAAATNKMVVSDITVMNRLEAVGKSAIERRLENPVK